LDGPPLLGSLYNTIAQYKSVHSTGVSPVFCRDTIRQMKCWKIETSGIIPGNLKSQSCKSGEFPAHFHVEKIRPFPIWLSDSGDAIWAGGNQLPAQIPSPSKPLWVVEPVIQLLRKPKNPVHSGTAASTHAGRGTYAGGPALHSAPTAARSLRCSRHSRNVRSPAGALL
jgi:hypothetical protein